MQNVERLSITLPTDMVRLIRSKVAGGGYTSNSDVIREAMRAWLAQEELRAERLNGIRAKIAEADADPRPSLSEGYVERHFAAHLKNSTKRRG